MGPAGGVPREAVLRDEFLRGNLPEVKIALGELIDGENQRALPDRYARLLPETTLVVALRPDVAQALAPIAEELEGDLTDSCSRHGSLYDRVYRVQLRRAERDTAPLFRVSVLTGREPTAQRPLGTAAPATPPASAPASAPADAVHVATAAPPAPPPAAPVPAAPVPAAPRPSPEPRPAHPEAASGWMPGRWRLVVDGETGTESHLLTSPVTTLGRASDNPDQRADIPLGTGSHISRRHLALAWEARGGEPGFRVYNVGLNSVTVNRREVPGAHVGRGPLQFEALAQNSEWVFPGTPIRVGEAGPTLRVEPLGEASVEIAEDPDRTVFG